MPDPAPRPTRRILTISLRVLMLVIVVLAVAIGWFTNGVRQKARILAALRAGGARVVFDDQLSNSRNRLSMRPNPQGNPPGSAWARKILGEDAFRTVAIVDIMRRVDPRSHTYDPATAKADDELLRQAAALGTVERLGINRAEVTDAGLARLPAFGKLSTLGFSYDANLTDAGFVHVARLPALKRLTIQFCPITDRGVAAFAGLSTLEALTLQGDQFTDACLDSLQGNTNLVSLSLISPGFTDTGLERLTGMASLKSLMLSNGTITDVGLATLAKLRSLESLVVRGVEPTPEGLRSLAGLEKLHYLNLNPSKTRLTDAHLEPLHQLTLLELLWLGNVFNKGTEFSDEAIVALVDALPKLRSLTLEPRYLSHEPIQNLKKTRPGFQLLPAR